MKLNALIKAMPMAWFPHKFLLVMKLTTLMIIFALVQVSARSFSQKITLNEKNTPLEKVINDLKKQSNYEFFYDDKDIKQNVTINIKDATIDEALGIMLKNTVLTFNISAKTVFLIRKEYPAIEKGKDSFAVPIDIHGRVVDSTGTPLVGASIKLKYSKLGVVTDRNGEFYFSKLADGSVLIISYISYKTQEVIISSQTASSLNIVLKLETSKLGEVIVNTGYQTLSEERSTGAFAQVNNRLFNRIVASNVLDHLDGVVSNLQFDRRQGMNNVIQIRGRSTILANANPLIVLDNFPYDGDINNINPDDVESVTILKDAAAASIWGTRAGNGVIVITTKKGRLNQPIAINVNANSTIGDKPNLFYLPRISSADFIDLEKNLFSKGFYSADEASYQHPVLSPVVELLIKQRDGKITAAQANTQIESLKNQDVRNDLNKYWYQKSVNQQYAINIRGGSDKATHYFSTAYEHDLSNLSNSYDRLNMRSENTFRLLANLEIGVGLTYTGSKSNFVKSDDQSIRSSGSKQIYPYAQLADAAGNPLPIAKNYASTFIQSSQSLGFLNWQYSPLDEANHSSNTSTLNDLLFKTSISYSILSWMRASVHYQFEQNQNQSRELHDQNSYYTRDLINQYTQNTASVLSRPIPLGGILGNGASKLSSNAVRGQLDIDRSWGRNQIVAIAGAESRTLSTTSSYGTTYGYSDDILTNQGVDYKSTFFLSNYSYLINSTIPYNNSFSSTNLYNFSEFINAAYTYNSLYTLSASARRDESNLFGVNSNQKGVPLYSAGFSWNVGGESFYKLKAVPILKLRATYGYSGNVDNSLSAQTTVLYGTSSLTKLPYATVNNPPNPDLRWERTSTLNFGFDFATKSNMLTGSLDYFMKKGNDLIGFQQIDPTTGVLNPATSKFQYKGNVAAMSGHGFDLSLNSRNIDREFKWETNLLFSYNHSEVTHYEALSDLGAGYVSNGYNINPLVGKPVYSILSYKWAGLDPQTGDPMGYLNGVPSKDYSSILSLTKINDLEYSGSAIPVMFGNLRNTVRFKSFSVSANLSYRFGYYFMKNALSYSGLINNWVTTGDYANRWQKPGDELITSVPSLGYPLNSNRDAFYGQASVNVFKADNIRFKDLTLSYDLNGKVFNKSLFKTFSVYAYLNNLGILWKANSTDLDPDYTYTPPPPRTYALGIKGTF